ncbi:hypothetical protein B0H19DRAFT_320558 [Mycena capillaripes]|nr:hypothetical protein B0H19DRAFT_320558 [Mycena capillaripes]
MSSLCPAVISGSFTFAVYAVYLSTCCTLRLRHSSATCRLTGVVCSQLLILRSNRRCGYRRFKFLSRLLVTSTDPEKSEIEPSVSECLL